MVTLGLRHARCSFSRSPGLSRTLPQPASNTNLQLSQYCPRSRTIERQSVLTHGMLSPPGAPRWTTCSVVQESSRMRDLRCTSAYKSPQGTYPSAIATTRASRSAPGAYSRTRALYPRYDTRAACIKHARILLFAMAATANRRFIYPPKLQTPCLK